MTGGFFVPFTQVKIVGQATIYSLNQGQAFVASVGRVVRCWQLLPRYYVKNSARLPQLSSVVWSLDAHNNTLAQLIDCLRDHAHEVLTPAATAIAVKLPATVPDVRLSLLLRRNVYFEGFGCR
jgi:hypothetical protein